jgi:siroheme synthase (precorrin-2 oxidase/ferrochelatase)
MCRNPTNNGPHGISVSIVVSTTRGSIVASERVLQEIKAHFRDGYIGVWSPAFGRGAASDRGDKESKLNVPG